MLHRPDAGHLLFDGIDLTAADARSLLGVRRRMQMIFQDPYSSLNPVRNVEEIIGLPLLVHDRLPRAQRREKVAAMMESVGLAPALMNRNPSQFSGGQRQRIGIARALILQPDFVVCDEPVSALDVSVQAQIIDLLKTLKNSLRLTYLFISHDLAVVASISDSIAVMYLGEIVELAPAEALIEAPRHPYTQILWSAIPRIGQKRAKPSAPPPTDTGERSETGCRFSGRCPRAMEMCHQVRPALRTVGLDHQVACHLYD
jgi:oligopeptide/dipeptide ABC transporter ATP-binding protein